MAAPMTEVAVTKRAAMASRVARLRVDVDLRVTEWFSARMSSNLLSLFRSWSCFRSRRGFWRGRHDAQHLIKELISSKVVHLSERP